MGDFNFLFCAFLCVFHITIANMPIFGYQVYNIIKNEGRTNII